MFSSNEIIIDIAQQVAWMAAAFRTSDCNRVQYSKVAICYETGGSSDFNITFAIEPLSKEEESCWFPLFLNPVIAFGFPIRERHNEEVGLELPIEMMVALGRTRHAIGEVVPFVGADPESHGIQAAANVMIKMAPSLLFKDPMPRGKDRYFDDEVSDIWSLLERLGESQNSEQSSPGKNLQTTMKTKVIGWEFMGLVDQKSPYVRKQIFVKTSCGGWPELVHDIDAVVLVAQGFEDIIRPVSELARLCSIWQSLPKHKYFMAAGVPILQKLCEEAGSDKTNQHLTSTKLKWHKGSLLFEDCLAHTNAGMVCKCDRLQQVVPEGITLRSIKPPGVLEANGCVIFGKPPSRSTAELSPNTTTNYLYTHPNNPIEMTTDTDSILIPRTLNGEGFQHLRPDNASAFS